MVTGTAGAVDLTAEGVMAVTAAVVVGAAITTRGRSPAVVVVRQVGA